MKMLFSRKKIDRKALLGKKEKYLLQVVSNPVEGVSEALVIAGSDRRGAIYGIYELSRQIGVSPWYWWMDVPVEVHSDIVVRKGSYTDGEPKVELRGIFINDEWPSFGNWAKEKFGGINSKCYAHVFELLLRLKGNFMWPAMWGSAFYDDDPENGVLANKMGVIMGTSHHEPMCLAQQDWKRRGNGEWNYQKNADGLKSFWATGIRRSNAWERVVTVGMRGDGDMAMDDDGNIPLMEKIVSDQRRIIEHETERPAYKTPQVWALYKEVQDYYDRGMKVPDDITLLLCDDNWGNVRRLPSLKSKPRRGGYGMYYHFDYVGAPRNTRWLNTNSVPRVWEQMNLAYSHGVRKLWIVNVGDIKPMEYPITFFLDMAWNPEAMNPGGLTAHSDSFCISIFGKTMGREASRLVRTHAQYIHRVTPEQLNAETYAFDEWHRVVAEYDRLLLDALRLGKNMPEGLKDAWFQLIGYPIEAMDNLYNMYYAQALNKYYAAMGDNRANGWANRALECFRYDSVLVSSYHSMADGKWNHMMDQVHIGYTSWNDPEKNVAPEVVYIDPKPCQAVFAERDGWLSIEAEHYSRKKDGNGCNWTVIPELGRTLSGITPLPVTGNIDGMRLEYDVDILTQGEAKVVLRFAPTLNFRPEGIRYAVCFDDEMEQVVNINGDYKGELGNIQKFQVIDSKTVHNLTKGRHTLYIRPLDNGLVLEKIIVDMGGMRYGYLGGEERRIR